MNSQDWVGGAWLVQRHGIDLITPLWVRSRIGGRRATHESEGQTIETYARGMRPEPTLRGHLTFHLKHEVLHLELLSRLFTLADPAELQAWVRAEPTGQYARRAGFLYEWLTGRSLEIPAGLAGGYVDAIDADILIAASSDQAVPSPRWRVRDNLPGTPSFCPLIRKTPGFEMAMAIDIRAMLGDLAHEFGDDALLRSAVWMTLRESRSSFAIEGEADQADRIARFADVLARRTGQGSGPLDLTFLESLQSDILGKRTSLQHMGLRQSPVFVGEVVQYENVVHYVAPPADDLASMLAGLDTFMQRTKGQSAVMRAAAVSFGFVYIHPLADGNGRVHRFLINDMLRRDGLVQAPMILPVSALIARDAAQRLAYNQTLDAVSRPLMSALAGHYAFEPAPKVYPDGIHSNFVCHGNAIARPAWRYPDLTPHAVYLADVLALTIGQDMRAQSQTLRSHARARAAIKDLLEMPDAQIDRVIRSVQANQGRLSNVMLKEIAALQDPGLWEAIVVAVNEAFKPQE